MKNLRLHTVFICISLVCFCSALKAQTTLPVNEPDLNRAKLFDNLPNRIPVNLNGLSGIFNTSIGEAVDISLSDNGQFRFDGAIVSTASNDKLQSVVIRSSSYNGAGFTISKIIADDGSVTFRGRIISLKHGDLFELQKEGDAYVLVKKNFYDLVNE